MRELRSERSGRLADTAYRGRWIQAFIPRDLPPEPPLALTPADENLVARANQAIGRLEGIRSTLPDANLFTYFYVRKEAVLSAQIEGTQSSLSDLLRFESGAMPGVPLDEVEEVSDYIAAMEMGMRALSSNHSRTTSAIRTPRPSSKPLSRTRSSRLFIRFSMVTADSVACS